MNCLAWANKGSCCKPCQMNKSSERPSNLPGICSTSPWTFLATFLKFRIRSHYLIRKAVFANFVSPCSWRNAVSFRREKPFVRKFCSSLMLSPILCGVDLLIAVRLLRSKAPCHSRSWDPYASVCLWVSKSARPTRNELDNGFGDSGRKALPMLKPQAISPVSFRIDWFSQMPP